MPDRLRLLFCDHLNLARGKYLPAGKIGDGASRFSQATFGVCYDKDLIPAPGSRMLEGAPDMQAVYRAEDIRSGWEPDTKVVIGDLMQADGSPVPMCGRQALKRAVKDWEALGLKAKVGMEIEAYAFERAADGTLRPYDTPQAYVYSTSRFADPRGFTDAIWAQAEKSGFKLESLTTEYDSPQFEFTLVYDDAVKAVDDHFLFRLMAREIAHDHGLLLTCLPKPLANKGGSGQHVNFSFLDKAGKNALGDPGQMSDLVKGCIAGLMHHHRGMAGLIAPIVNSYARLQPASMSGYWRNWGGDHRGVTTRISAEGGAKARIEHRMGDGAANPYVLVATVLQAARLGVVNAYPLPPAETGDCFGSHDATEGVPDGLSGALDALEADTDLSVAVGQILVDNHVFVKRDEIGKTTKLEGDALRDFYINYV
jgi:glutamine synthetase